MTEKTILACPFCGGEAAYYASQEAVFRAEWTGHVYHCTKCQARVQNTDRMTAQSMWNTRVPVATINRKMVQYVVDKFKKDEAQGYHTRDREFAIEILEKALSIK